MQAWGHVSTHQTLLCFSLAKAKPADTSLHVHWPAVQVSREIAHSAIDPATQVSHQQDALGTARSCQLGLSELPCRSWIQPWALALCTEFFLWSLGRVSVIKPGVNFKGFGSGVKRRFEFGTEAIERGTLSTPDCRKLVQLPSLIFAFES